MRCKIARLEPKRVGIALLSYDEKPMPNFRSTSDNVRTTTRFVPQRGEMKRSLVTVFLLLGISGFAPQPASAEPPTNEDVLRLFEVMRFTKQMEDMRAIMMEQVAVQFQQAAGQQFQKLPPEHLSELQKLMQDLINETFAAYSPNAMMLDMLPVYQKHLTRADVLALIDFYTTPAGQRFLDKMPQMTRETMAINMAKSTELTRSIMPKMQERIREFMEKTSPSPPDRKSAPVKPPRGTTSHNKGTGPRQ